MKMENKIHHLGMIQDVIKRMANNSFALKGWAVTLVAAIFALASKDANILYFLISFIPVTVFWFLDSYYLLQERLYRELYKEVCQIRNDDEVSFSLAAPLEKYKSERCDFWDCFKSKTELWFYLPLAVICFVVFILTAITRLIAII